MNVRDLAARAQRASQSRTWLIGLEIIVLTEQVVKLRLYASPDLFIQAYRNDRYDTSNFALIHQGRRLYARDELAGQWHRHPTDDPSQHDKSTDGQRQVTLEEFLDEVEIVLAEQGLR